MVRGSCAVALDQGHGRSMTLQPGARSGCRGKFRAGRAWLVRGAGAGLERVGGGVQFPSLDRDNPADSLASPQQHSAHEAQGRQLAIRLARERPDLEIYAFQSDIGVVRIWRGRALGRDALRTGPVVAPQGAAEQAPKIKREYRSIRVPRGPSFQRNCRTARLQP